MVARPGDQMASGTMGRGHLRASDADREQLIDTLKDAFALGQLTRDELVARVARALTSRTCAELAAIAADVTAPLTRAQPRPQPEGLGHHPQQEDQRQRRVPERAVPEAGVGTHGEEDRLHPEDTLAHALAVEDAVGEQQIEDRHHQAP